MLYAWSEIRSKLLKISRKITPADGLQILLERDSDISFKTLADKYGIHYSTLRTETKRFRKKVKKLFDKIFKG